MTRFLVRRLRTPASLAIAVAIAIPMMGGASWFAIRRGLFQGPQPQLQENRENAAILSLLGLPATQRRVQLETLARSGSRLEQNRARYLLASDAIEQQQGNQALTHLQGLEKTYVVLAPEILQKRAEAYELSEQPAQAQATWKTLLQQYSDSPVAAAALYGLGQEESQYWDQAIADFPAHPLTVEIAQRRLQENPDQLPLLLLLARHGLYLPEITTVLDKLVAEYSDRLQPQNWDAIAFGYWEHLEYGKAGAAYARAPRTALTAYRTGRGFQLSGQGTRALEAYQRLVTGFPQTEEAALGWLKMAELAEQPTQALQYLERAIQLSERLQLTNRAGEARLAKMDQLVQQGQSQAAAQVRQQLLSGSGNTDAAAELRWRYAQERAAAQDWAAAQQWSWQIVENNPESEVAPQAAFWTGKWASQSGQSTVAETAFQKVLDRYPTSYYAWRVASLAGWEVGNFSQVRSLNPRIQALPQRLPLPAGSDALQELHQIGQDREAWTRWQWEFQNRVQPTAEEQLTDGVLRLGVGDYLDGLFMVSNLSDRARNEPEVADRYQAWRQQPNYWQTLYPLPYLSAVENFSQQRSLNPLLVMALIRQESRFETDIRSVAGAVGLMQVMPETAAWVAPQAGLRQYALEQPQDNLNLGTWYLDYTHRTYGNDSMLAIASYNAGPGNVAEWVQRYGLSDPDAFVEAIPFPETKDYVKSVFANYWNYLRLYNPEVAGHLDQQRDLKGLDLSSRTASE